MSPSMRRVWIEITADKEKRLKTIKSPSMRRVWIEISGWSRMSSILPVTLHAEGVD